jgi:hypothetical protein
MRKVEDIRNLIKAKVGQRNGKAAKEGKVERFIGM